MFAVRLVNILYLSSKGYEWVDIFPKRKKEGGWEGGREERKKENKICKVGLGYR